MKHKIGLIFSGAFFIFATIYIVKNQMHLMIFEALNQINPVWFMIAIAFACLYVLLEATILWVFINKDIKYSFFLTLRVTVVGLFFSGITPFNTGGQPAQIIELKEDKISVGKSSSYLMIKFIIYQAVLVLYTMLLMLIKIPLLSGFDLRFNFLILVGFSINLLVILSLCLITLNVHKSQRLVFKMIIFLKRLHIIKSPLKCMRSAKGHIDQFYEQIQIMKKSWPTALKVTAITILQLTAYFLVPYFIYRSFGLNAFTWHDFIATTAFVLLITAFIPLPGGSGGAEGSFYYLFSQFFIGNLIIPAILIWRLVTYYSWMFIGAIVLMIKKERSFI